MQTFFLAPDNVWKYLVEIYEGTDIPRLSIEVDIEKDDGKIEKEYVVEVFSKDSRSIFYLRDKKYTHVL